MRINLFIQRKLRLNSKYICRKFFFYTVKLPICSVFVFTLQSLEICRPRYFFCPISLSTKKEKKTLEMQFSHIMYTFSIISLSCGSITIWFCFFKEHMAFIFSTDPLFNALHNFSCVYNKTLLDRKLLRCFAKRIETKNTTRPPNFKQLSLYVSLLLKCIIEVLRTELKQEDSPIVF